MTTGRLKAAGFRSRKLWALNQGGSRQDAADRILMHVLLLAGVRVINGRRMTGRCPLRRWTRAYGYTCRSSPSDADTREVTYFQPERRLFCRMGPRPLGQTLH